MLDRTIGEADAEGEDSPNTSKIGRILRFDLTAAGIADLVGRYVIGQDDAVQTLALSLRRHLTRIKDKPFARPGSPRPARRPFCSLGPTGCGKTRLCNTLTRISGLPFAQFDLTGLTEQGWVGASVDDIILQLLAKAGG